MTMHQNNWTEADLYKSGFHAVRTFDCPTCGEEVTVYESDRVNKKLFLTSTMEVHPLHQGYDE